MASVINGAVDVDPKGDVWVTTERECFASIQKVTNSRNSNQRHPLTMGREKQRNIG